MTKNQQAADIISQAVCAMVRAMGMQADNSQHPEDQPHTKEDFDALIEKMEDRVIRNGFLTRGSPAKTISYTSKVDVVQSPLLADDSMIQYMTEAFAGDKEKQQKIANAFKLPVAYLFAPETLGKDITEVKSEEEKT